MTVYLRTTTINKCQEKLLAAREETLAQLFSIKVSIRESNFNGDEIDRTNSQLSEMRMLTQQQRLKNLLVEIDVALSKIQNGRYGFCEQTEEPIKEARLLAIPWTRLSIEGAEVSDRLSKRYKQTGRK